MSLLDLANKTMAEFDPKKDNINAGNQALPAGEYEMIIENIGHDSFESGWDCLTIVFQVVSGEQVGRKEFNRISFAETAKSGKAIPDFVLDRNIKFVSKLASLTGIPMKADYFAGNETDVHENLSKALFPSTGQAIKLIITDKPNKKDPDNPFREYELAEAPKIEEIQVDDNELPFD